MIGTKIGALWKKTAKESGMVFYSGTIDTMFGRVSITVFKNDKKEKDNQPDLNIVFGGCTPYEDKRKSNSSGSDPFGDDGRASPTDDPFGDKPSVQGKGMDIETGEDIIEL